MSFWERLGDAAEAVGKTGVQLSPIGMAWDIAKSVQDKDGVREVAGEFARRHSEGVTAAPSNQDVYNVLNFVPRSTTALGLQADSFVRGRGFLGVNEGWNEAADISPGQAFGSLATGLPGVPMLAAKAMGDAAGDRSFDVTDTDQREPAFEEDWSGRIGTGALDVAIAWFADPTVLLGKGAAAARGARTLTRGNAEVEGAVALARSGEELRPGATALVGLPGRGRQEMIAQRLRDFAARTDGKSEAELMNDPLLRQTTDAGALAYFMARANTIEDEATRHSTKLDAFAVALGDKGAIERIRTQRADLAAEWERLNSPVEATVAADRFSWDDAGQGALDFFNNDPKRLAELDAKKADIDAAIERLDRLEGIAGEASKFAPNVADRLGHSIRNARMRETVLQDGLASVPVRVVAGATGHRVPGYVNTEDALLGADHLRDTLRRSRYLKADDKSRLLDEFGRAANQAERNRVIEQAEQMMWRAHASHHGIPVQTAEQLYQAAMARRQAVLSTMKSRLYSGSDAGKVTVIDDDGMAHVFNRAFLDPHLRASVPVTDPKVLETALKRAKRTGYSAVGRNAAEGAMALADDGLAFLTRGWKDLALMRPAYPLRIQVDTQLRLLASLKGQYLVAAAAGTKNLATNWANRATAQEMARLGVDVNELAAKGGVGEVVTHKGVSFDVIRPTERRTIDDLIGSENASVHQILQSTTERELYQMRASGQWQAIRGGEKGWGEAQIRAINNQIRNSPVAMRILSAGGDNAAIAAWVRKDRAGFSEWREFRNDFPDLDAWIDEIRVHLDHTLPQPHMRAAVAEREITAADIDEWFADVASRPVVHGEAQVPIARTLIGAEWSKLRQSYYKWVNDMPETVLGRHPLYVHRFKEHMTRMIDNLDASHVTSADVERLRRSASQLARRDVNNTMFDLSRQSNIAHWFRFVSPFFAAWEDTMMKWSRLFYDDPDTAARFALAWEAPEAVGIVQEDENGEKYIIIPGTGGVDGAGAWTIRKDSFNLVFSGEPWWAPGFGPLVQVPANEIVKRAFPEAVDDNTALGKVLRLFLPFNVQDENAGEQIVPAWAKRLNAAWGITEGGEDQFAQTYALLYAQETVRRRQAGLEPPTKAEVNQLTRNWFFARAFAAGALPVSGTPQPVLQFYVEEARRYRRDYGRDWQEKFYEDYPDYYEMSISLSENTTGVEATEQAYNAAQRWRPFIAENPEYGWFFVGPDNVPGFDAGVYAAQSSLSIGLGERGTWRDRKDPGEAMQDVQAEKGWMEYRSVSTELQLALEERGLTSLNQRGAEDLAAIKRDFIDELKQENPAWATAFGQRDTQKVEGFLRMAVDSMEKDSRLAARADMVALQDYLAVREDIRQVMAERGTGSLDNEVNADLREIWDEFTTAWVQENLGAEQMFQRVLEADDLRASVY